MKSRFRVASVKFPARAVLFFLTASLTVVSGAEVTRTATPVPRLSGGFGRPRATPAPTPSAETGGQSLADAVHAAQQSRSGPASEKSGLTIDNKSLVRSEAKGRVTTSKTAAPQSRPAAAPPAAKEGGEHGDTAAPAGSATGGTEAEWREIAARARRGVADAKARVEELEAAARKLENDFYAWDDGQYRDRVIKPSWDRARGDLEAARKSLAEAEKELSELPEKARKAGALPGWIRE